MTDNTLLVIVSITAIASVFNAILQAWWFWTTKEPSYKKFIAEFDKQEHEYEYEQNQSTGSLPEGFIKPNDGL